MEEFYSVGVDVDANMLNAITFIHMGKFNEVGRTRQKNTLIKLWRKGTEPKIIADRLGREQRSIVQKARKLGLPKKDPSPWETQ